MIRPRANFCLRLLSIFSLGIGLTAVEAQAQESGWAEKLSYGVQLGAVVSEFDNAQPHTGSRLGFTAGGFGAYQLNDLFSVQAGLSYFQQGGTYVQFINDTRFGAEDNFLTRNVKDASVILHNIHVPIQAKITPFGENSLLPHFLVGPYVDVMLTATERYQRTGEIDGQVLTTATGRDVVTDRFNRLQFGGIAGFQFELPFENEWTLVMSAVYKYGITPVKDAHSYIDFVEVTEDMTSNALAVSLGIKF